MKWKIFNNYFSVFSGKHKNACILPQKTFRTTFFFFCLAQVKLSSSIILPREKHYFTYLTTFISKIICKVVRLMYFLRWETSHVKMQICVKNNSLTAEESLWKNMNSTHFCRVTLQGDLKLTKGLQNQNAQLWSQTLLHRKVSGMASLISAMLQQCKIIFLIQQVIFFLFFTCLLAFRIYENIFFFQIVDKKTRIKGKK